MWSDSHLYQKSHWEPTSSWISQRLSSNTWLDYEKELHSIFVFPHFWLWSIMKCPQPHIRESLHVEQNLLSIAHWGWWWWRWRGSTLAQIFQIDLKMLIVWSFQIPTNALRCVVYGRVPIDKKGGNPLCAQSIQSTFQETFKGSKRFQHWRGTISITGLIGCLELEIKLSGAFKTTFLSFWHIWRNKTLCCHP